MEKIDPRPVSILQPQNYPFQVIARLFVQLETCLKFIKFRRFISSPFTTQIITTASCNNRYLLHEFVQLFRILEIDLVFGSFIIKSNEERERERER